MGDVVNFNGETTLDLDANRTLENLKNENLEGFITKGGEEFFSSTYADASRCLWLTERFKKALLDHENE
jgi:hypothetical protein